MSSSVLVTVTCDGQCGRRESERMRLGTLRGILAARGWRYDRGRDICPECWRAGER